MLVDRHHPAVGPFRPNCTHTGKFAKTYRCKNLTLFDIKSFYNLVYTKPVKEFQDQVLVQHMERKLVQRRRVPPGEANRSPSSYTGKYYITTARKERVPVCFQAFMRITQMSKSRLNLLNRKMHVEGYVSDKRGGFRQQHKYSEQKEDIKEFINQFPPKESHYCRSKVKRLYLHSDLNIQKMFRLYKKEKAGTKFEKTVKPSYFRFVFRTYFNLGFGAPVTDACSTCISLQERIRASKGKGVLAVLEH